MDVGGASSDPGQCPRLQVRSAASRMVPSDIGDCVASFRGSVVDKQWFLLVEFNSA